MNSQKLGQKAVEALESALNLKLPEDCEIEVTIRNMQTADDGEVESVKVNLVQEKAVASRFEVRRISGAVDVVHRT